MPTLMPTLREVTVTVGARFCFSNPGDQKNGASSMKETHTHARFDAFDA